MSATRERRCNAGNRMGKLLEAEDEDDFYKTTYGGFGEEADDNDYHSEASLSDNVDTDFSIDENDEVRSDDDDEPRRKKRLVTKAYREPVKKPPNEKDEQKPKKKKLKKLERSAVQIYQSNERRNLRKSTVDKAKETEERGKVLEAKTQLMKDFAKRKNLSDVRRLTQEELLAEAKITEKQNLRSLKIYQRLESEKKKARVKKDVFKGATIRYQSVMMPLIEQLPTEAEINVVGETSEDRNADSELSTQKLNASEKCERTFITFTDEKVFREYFPRKRPKAPSRQYCPVTRLPAKYFDPVTRTPYATAKAFRMIRDSYMQQLKGKRKGDVIASGTGHKARSQQLQLIQGM